MSDVVIDIDDSREVIPTPQADHKDDLNQSDGTINRASVVKMPQTPDGVMRKTPHGVQKLPAKRSDKKK